MSTRDCLPLPKYPVYNIYIYQLYKGTDLISACDVFQALGIVSVVWFSGNNPWWRCNQHRFTPGDSISRSPKKQSRVINKETRSRCPKLARRVRFPHGIALCGLYPRGRVSLHCGWLFHVVDYCRPIIVAAK